MSQNVDITEPIITNNSYSISKIKKLIDLNHDMINFKVTFNISAEEDRQFKALIVNQSTLDTVNSDDMEYKTVNGSLSGEIIADKNVYQNYFIILKSDIPMSVNVELQTTRLPDYIEKKTKKKTKKKPESSSFMMSAINAKYILIGIAVIVVLYFLICKSNGTGGDGLPKSGMNQSLLTKLRKIPLE